MHLELPDNRDRGREQKGLEYVKETLENKAHPEMETIGRNHASVYRKSYRSDLEYMLRTPGGGPEIVHSNL